MTRTRNGVVTGAQEDDSAKRVKVVLGFHFIDSDEIRIDTVASDIIGDIHGSERKPPKWANQ